MIRNLKLVFVLMLWLAAGAGLAWAQDELSDIAGETTEVIGLEDGTSEDAPGEGSSTDGSVYEPEWDALAERAAEAIDADQASTAALAEIRAELAEWREVFLARQDVNARRIDTLRARLEALGEEPEEEAEAEPSSSDGAAIGDAGTAPAPEAADEPATGTESEALADLRQALKDQLGALTAPGILAAEAYAQANGLIAEIDALIRERQAAQFMERDVSPLTPSAWTPALDSLWSALRASRGEISDYLADPNKLRLAWDTLPQTLLLALVALVFLTRGRTVTARVEGMIRARTLRGQAVWTFVASVGRVALPFLGLLALTSAVLDLGFTGRRISAVLAALPIAGLYPLVAHWLARHLLTEETGSPTILAGMPAEGAARLKSRFITLGYVTALAALFAVWIDVSGIYGTSAAVLQFPIGLAVAFTIFRIGQALISSRPPVEEDEEGTSQGRGFREQIVGLLGRLAMVDAVLGVVLACLGFVFAFEMVVYPATGTLYLLAALVLAQRLVFDLYGLLTGAEAGESDGLVPVTIAFLLTLAAVPVLALLWGARVTDLTELWARFREGFDIGGTVISPGNFLTFIIVFIIGFTLVRLLQGALKSSILPQTKLDAGGRNAVNAGVGYLGIFIAAVVAITTAGIDLSGLAIVAGALSVGIGFGLQNIVSNFVSGIILLIERPIGEGDWIEVGENMGYVRDISVRSTRIETFDRTDVIIPNADLVSGTVTNYTRGNSVGRLIIKVGVAHGTDTRRVEEVLQEVAESHTMVLLNPKPLILFAGFGADSLEFEVRAILRDVNWILNVQSELNHAIAKRFAEEGFEIPFAQRDIWLRNAEVLRAGEDAPTDAEDDGAFEDRVTGSAEGRDASGAGPQPGNLTEDDLHSDADDTGDADE